MKLFIFGSTGDLVKRKVLPALNNLNLKNLEVFAIGRKDFVNELYLDFACKQNCVIRDKIHYFKANFDSEEVFEDCIKILDKKSINYFYVSLPPKLFPLVISKIAKIKKLGFKVSILFEKPFGTSLEESKKLYTLIKKSGLEKNILFADHYLFKPKIILLKRKKFKNLIIESIEKVGLEDRITYYDEVGALKDMVQSHLLGILFKILSKKEINSIRVKDFVKKQYNSYGLELGKNSKTETFVSVDLTLGKKSIKIITGKGFDKKQNVIIIDGKKIDFESGKPYEKMIFEFLNHKTKNFPKIDQILLSWKIIKKIESKKTMLGKYDLGSIITDFY